MKITCINTIGRNVLLCMWIAFPLILFSQTSNPQITWTDINPNRSNNNDADAATGGRCNRLGWAADLSTVYAASEWGGLWKSTNTGDSWVRLDSFIPSATWECVVDPNDNNKLVATSFFDGRYQSFAGVSTSTDGGLHWDTIPLPPHNFCETEQNSYEKSAFGVAIDPSNSNNIYAGTNCGLVKSSDGGTTWTYIDPVGGTATASIIWDVIVHDDESGNSIVDVVGDKGHFRSTDGGSTWTTATSSPLPGGISSITVSPDESYVLFATVGVRVYESDDGGQSWPFQMTNPQPQGRIPFVKTNQRSTANQYDLWFGDVGLWRATCTTPTPAAPGGSRRCPQNAWSTSFTRRAGGHDDVGDIMFDPTATTDACPLLFCSDGGVYVNTVSGSPGCQSPVWTEPTVTPHALWVFGMDGANQIGTNLPQLYYGCQDNGTFGTTNLGVASPVWNNTVCCDGFDEAATGSTIMYNVCCCPTCTPQNRYFLAQSGYFNAAQLNAYPPGTVNGWRSIPQIAQYAQNEYAFLTTRNMYFTSNINANPIPWTVFPGTIPTFGGKVQGGVKHSVIGGTDAFFMLTGPGTAFTSGQLWMHVGTGTGAWALIAPPGNVGSFSIFDVDPNNGSNIIACYLPDSKSDPQMVLTTDGGINWTSLDLLDGLMRGLGTFLPQNQTGPVYWEMFDGYPESTMLSFNPSDSNFILAGGADSGVFLTSTMGSSWQLISSRDRSVGNMAHISRPFFANWGPVTSSGGNSSLDIWVGSQGRGIWKVNLVYN